MSTHDVWTLLDGQLNDGHFPGFAAVLFTQRAPSAPLGEFDRFWTAVYA